MKLAPELPSRDAVYVEVDPVVGVHQQKADGLREEQSGSGVRVCRARFNKSPEGERCCKGDPHERQCEEHVGDTALALSFCRRLAARITARAMRQRVSRHPEDDGQVEDEHQGERQDGVRDELQVGEDAVHEVFPGSSAALVHAPLAGRELLTNHSVNKTEQDQSRCTMQKTTYTKIYI